ncbi:P-loop containing nucleoside triphosphate hydrolase protein [Gloeophyllum trabeum ATCC 11539]|uniref:p-loop containing nucleoside triphosphate hydrolase protein n=1 Tax=Gloeophyllum trabeum (strain ATCC 11539 / FP-39264 / Madison 617) TaxID=670483 RepID=S7RBD5_GLOTA|nr:P-loop containing nucleoside triphosphate hydrolase protein [Gloeophyllum trabeum ATCC 11539]EPQ51535.1 P-loop containing nucleoside triphosphate hydrolase protein [Gloeophyllum trabeum ATCC 11539]
MNTTDVAVEGSIFHLPFLATFPSPAIREYIRIFALGLILSLFRDSIAAIRERILSIFFLTASFREDTVAYSWMMVWLSQQPTWRNARRVEVTTRDLLSVGIKSVWDHSRKEDSSSDKMWRRMTFLPSLGFSHMMWYHRHLVLVYREKENIQSEFTQSQIETLTIRIFTFDHAILSTLLQQAKNTFDAVHSQATSVFIYDTMPMGRWKQLGSFQRRPFDSLILEPGVKESVVEDARDFLNSRDWYHRRGIPFRRGYLLYGAPGSGKSSLIQCVAGELGLDVYIISIKKERLDDSGLMQLMGELPERCIAIMEDIDVAFKQELTREAGDGEGKSENDGKAQAPVVAIGPPKDGSVTLSGLLNAIDGVGAQEGRILFATTNKYLALDPALCRPGRMDRHIEFKHASRYQARELFRTFYAPGDDAPMNPNGSLMHDFKTSDSKHEVSDLASQFADAVPDESFSMASLQGYLMMYKTSHQEAATNIADWVVKETEAQAKKSGKI